MVPQMAGNGDFPDVTQRLVSKCKNTKLNGHAEIVMTLYMS
jgi:hypothetical protein